jgi:hypothetical protein
LNARYRCFLVKPFHDFPPLDFERRFAAILIGWCRAALAREGHMPVTMGRRELIAALGGAAAAWPLTATRLTAFSQGLQQLGWSVGLNLRIDYRWGDGQDRESAGPHRAG